MTLTWTDWQKDLTADTTAKSYLTPYANWYLHQERQAMREERFQPLSQREGSPRTRFPFVMHDLPLPTTAVPEGSKGINPPEQRKDVEASLKAELKPADVIIGVVDAGLALSHERFRRRGGVGTRILSYWQQGGHWEDQRHLPFGRELMQDRIDDLMGPTPDVDESGFNLAAGLVNFADPTAERWVETAAPHGTHVTDLAAGCDPFTTDPHLARFRERTHLILVDLAPRPSIGPAGSFLQDYAIWAIEHIVTTADAIWKTLKTDDQLGGFPVVINLSYGFNAGPKAGTSALQKYVRLLNHQRWNGPPVRLVLPAGNDNLSQGSAVLGRRAAGRTASLGWRILPEDRTSSYAEVWVDPKPEKRASTIPSPGTISLSPPGGPAGPGSAGAPGQFCDLLTASGQTVARIYCRTSDTRVGVVDLDHKVTCATGYVLCVAPTWRAEGVTAPSGEWLVTLGEGPLAKLHVQSDQTLVPGYGTSHLSYFEETQDTPACQRYQKFNEDGSLRDTYWRNPICGTVENIDSAGPVRRQNTMNALAGSFGILTIAGYRATDGWPAAYSGTARGKSIGGEALDTRETPDLQSLSGGGKALMEAACISDDGSKHIGRLAAGGRSGSAVVMQGTSFAAAEATRIVAGMLLDWVDQGCPDTQPASASDFTAKAAGYETGPKQRPQAPPPGFTSKAADLELKLGKGRFPRQRTGRVDRIVSQHPP